MTSPERVLAKICTSDSHRERPTFPSRRLSKRRIVPTDGQTQVSSHANPRAQSVRLRGQPHARNDLCKSLRGACWCWRRWPLTCLTVHTIKALVASQASRKLDVYVWP